MMPPCTFQDELIANRYNPPWVYHELGDCLTGPGGGDWWSGDCYYEELISAAKVTCAYNVTWHPANPSCRHQTECLPCSAFDLDKDGDRDLADFALFQTMKPECQ